jgi:leucyl aminopeptidase
MKVHASGTPAQDLAVDALALPITAGDGLPEAAGAIDESLGGLLTDVLAGGEHRGQHGETIALPAGGRLAARRVLLYGLGAAADLDGQRLRYAHHDMARFARRRGYRRLAVVRAGALREDDLGAVVEGCVMGDWEPRSHQTGDPRAQLEELLLLGFGKGREAEAEAACQLGEATNRARRWQNLPANELGPDGLAQTAREIAERHGLEMDVLGPDELRAGGFRLLLGVSAGSAQPPRLIRLEHRGAQPNGAAAMRLALIGKGITFDSGGLSIKPAESMSQMKGDMAGAAAVLAAIDVIASRRLGLDVMAVVAASENLIGPQAQRPGDVVTSANGKTVEIVNTDAEGRLVLADALTYAIRLGATHLVDVATLTGAATVALGHAATAVVAGDDRLWGLVERAGARAGYRVWRLPIYPEYRELLRSQIADLRNAFYGEAGTITGGMFIQEFSEGRPWAHLDIAASSWNSNARLSGVPRGPLGTGTRLLVNLAELIAQTHR